MTTWPNWVDLVVVTITLKMCYNGYVRGVVTELFYLVGAVCVTVLSISFWGVVAERLRPWVAFPPHIVGPLAFWVLFLTVWVMARILVRSLTGLMRWERLHWLLQSVGVVLGGVRGLWWSGFLLLLLSSSGFIYLQQSVEERSILGPRLATASREAIGQIAARIPGSPPLGHVLIPPVIQQAKP